MYVSTGVMWFQTAGANWRSHLGVLFLTTNVSLFMAGVGQAVIYPSEWPKVCREYMSGSNAIGPYVLARLVYTFPWLLGTVLMSTIIFWMTGR
jgi:hypothetical protein